MYGHSKSRLLLVTASLLFFAAAQAQSSSEQAEIDLDLAVQTLAEAKSYHFRYSMRANADATSLIVGEGLADRQTNAWSYTVVTDLRDPGVDHSANGEWITVDDAFYHNDGNGWNTGKTDFTTSGIATLLAPFMSYGTLKWFDSEDTPIQEIAWVGRDFTHGVEADHYTFATKDVPLYGTARFDAWIAKEGDDVILVVLAVTPEGGLTNQVTYHKINEPVAIKAPN